MRTLYNVMIERFAEDLSSVAFEVISIEPKVTIKDDGTQSKYVRISVEIPKGNDSLSRCRLAVKIPDGNMKFTNDEIDKKDIAINFKNLCVSYIDEKHNMYFKADDYTVVS